MLFLPENNTCGTQQVNIIITRHCFHIRIEFSIANKFELQNEISNNVICATSKASDQPAHTRSLIRAFASGLNILWVLLSEHHLEFLSLTEGCICLSESTHVNMPHCWKSHEAALLYSTFFL